MGFSPGLGVSPGVGSGNPLPLQHSCLENPMDRGAWRAIVRGAAKSRTQLSTQHKFIAMFSNWCISSVQLLSHAQLFATPWTPARQASLSITNSRSLLKLMSIESVMPSKHLILSSHSPPAFNLSQHQGLFK